MNWLVKPEKGEDINSTVIAGLIWLSLLCNKVRSRPVLFTGSTKAGRIHSNKERKEKRVI
jgi:hypothetical protein